MYVCALTNNNESNMYSTVRKREEKVTITITVFYGKRCNNKGNAMLFNNNPSLFVCCAVGGVDP